MTDNPWMNQPDADPYPTGDAVSERCGYALVDNDGEEYPCDRPATGWRWYQDVPHEDALDVACELHENEGGRRIHEAESAQRWIDQLEAAIGDLYKARDEAEMERDSLRAKVAAVQRLLEGDDYDPYVHANEGCQGEPDCARCWADDIRNALGNPKESE